MGVLTIRAKNQITIPRDLLDQAGLKQGDPIELESLPGGGIGVYPYGRRQKRESLWDWAVAVAESIPGLADVELELPPREVGGPREVEW